MDSEVRRANAILSSTRRLQTATGALLNAESIEDLDRTLVDIVPGAIGFERVALLHPAAENRNAALVHTLGYPPLDVSRFPKGSVLSAGGFIDGIVTGDEESDPPPVANVRGSFVIAPLRERGRLVCVLYADTLREDVETADAASGIAYALDIAGIVRANLSLAAERDRLTEELSRLARTDPLTGLPNRRVLEERLEEELRRSARTRKSFAFGIADLDHFKKINDTYGHPAGDAALQKFAGALRSQARHPDFVARFAGDEFALMLIDVDLQCARVIAERMVEAIFALRAGDGEHLSASIGFTLSYPVDTAESIIERADAALYRAKEAGRNRSFFG
jgi:diguanylate cyclase (GGDEF)-like protein